MTSSWSKRANARPTKARNKALETVRDFEDILELLERHEVRYLIIGGLAFTYHAMPRYTKDIDLWLDPTGGNVARVNQALSSAVPTFSIRKDLTRSFRSVSRRTGSIFFGRSAG